MYTFYTDKNETFECNLSLEGAKLNECKARLVLESENYNLLFYGSLDESGKCSIPVKRLKNLLSESDTGKVRLEVIAEDTYFEPWSDSYDVKTSKKVTVEVINKTEEKPKIVERRVAVTEVKQAKVPTKLNEASELFLRALKKKNITVTNLKDNIKLLNNLCEILSKKYSLNENEKKYIAENIISKLK